MEKVINAHMLWASTASCKMAACIVQYKGAKSAELTKEAFLEKTVSRKPFKSCEKPITVLKMLYNVWWS